MNIQYAILGLLRGQPMTGYDMKKAMQKSPLIYWSGNNNQIYRALAELEADGLVAAKVHHGDASPTKKIYTLTENGMRELRRLSLQFPEAPEVRKTFLMQLVFAGDLTKTELETLLEQYERLVRGEALAVQEEALSGTPYETAIHTLALENIRQAFAAELSWTDKVRSVALPLAPATREPDPAQPAAQPAWAKVEKNGNAYLHVTSGQVRTEQDGLSLVAACVENGVRRVLLPSLSSAFTQLSSGVAGHVLQKFANYNIKAAAVMPADSIHGKFTDLLLEAHRGTFFHVFDTLEEAENWLTQEEPQ